MGQTKLMRERKKHNALKLDLKKKNREKFLNAYVQYTLGNKLQEGYTVLITDAITITKGKQIIVLKDDEITKCDQLINEKKKTETTTVA